MLNIFSAFTVYKLTLVMGFAYQIKDQAAIHFVTFTTHQWADVFTRPIYFDTLIDSLKYCQREKGLEIFAWVIMTNHCHLIVRAKNENLSAKRFQKVYRQKNLQSD